MDSGALAQTTGGLIRPAAYAPIIAGRLYTPGHLSGQAPIRTDVAQSAYVADRIYWSAFIIEYDVTLTEIVIRTNSGHVGSPKANIGIYRDSNGVPGSLHVESGPLTLAAATTNYNVTALATKMPIGIYWRAFITDTAQSSNNNIISEGHFAATTTAIGYPFGGATSTTDNAGRHVGAYSDLTYTDTLPSTAPAFTGYDAIGRPSTWFIFS